MDLATLPIIEPEALLRWTLRVLRGAGFELRAAAARDHELRVVALAETPRAVARFATWFPNVVARPLATVDAYVQALARVKSLAARP